MAQNKDLRFQSTTPSTPGASVARYYAGTSGELKFVAPNGTVYDAQSFYVTTNANGVVTLTSGTFRDSAGHLSSGYFYGTTGTKIIQTALGEPNAWISVNVSGATYSVPAYTRS